jgi:hypothetical protein
MFLYFTSKSTKNRLFVSYKLNSSLLKNPVIFSFTCTSPFIFVYGITMQSIPKVFNLSCKFSSILGLYASKNVEYLV